MSESPSVARQSWCAGEFRIMAAKKPRVADRGDCWSGPPRRPAPRPCRRSRDRAGSPGCPRTGMPPGDRRARDRRTTAGPRLPSPGGLRSQIPPLVHVHVHIGCRRSRRQTKPRQSTNRDLDQSRSAVRFWHRTGHRTGTSDGRNVALQWTASWRFPGHSAEQELVDCPVTRPVPVGGSMWRQAAWHAGGRQLRVSECPTEGKAGQRGKRWCGDEGSRVVVGTNP